MFNNAIDDLMAVNGLRRAVITKDKRIKQLERTIENLIKSIDLELWDLLKEEARHIKETMNGD